MVKRGKFDLKAMEKDILDVAHRHGALGSFHGPHTPASRVLHDKYNEGEEREQLFVVIDHLLEERFLFPIYELGSTNVVPSHVRGMTPKGLMRLRELQRSHLWNWMRNNGFAVAIALITAGAAIGSILVEVLQD